ncbi:MAG: AsmA family protein, partial [Shimia sp.]|nr:AsmA family protein [Shimia sp.]
MAALGGDIRIKKIELIAPDVLLETNTDGAANWDILPTSEEAAEPTTSSSGSIALENMVIRDARLRYMAAGQPPVDISNLSATLAWPDRSKPAKFSLTTQPAQTPFSVKGMIADLDGILAGQISDVDVEATAAKGQVSFAGRASLAPEAAGTVTANLPDADAFLAALGLDGGLPGSASLTGDITLTRDMTFSLRQGTATAFGNTMTAQADVNLAGSRPAVTAQIATQTLDLKPIMSSEGDSSSSSGWSKTPIDASALGLIDGNIGFAAEAIDLGDIQLGRTRATIAIDNARAVATLSDLQAYEGTVTGKFVANNRNGLSVRADLTVAQIALQPVLTATADIDSFTGKADLRTSVLGSGQSMFAIMNSLDGEGAVSVGRGTIEGIDLDELLRGDVTRGTTVFDNMNASWNVMNGVMKNDDLRMELPRLAATGEGTIGLGLRTINYVVSPQIRGDDAPLLIVPVKIEGSWDNPSIAPELDKVIKQNFAKETEELEQKAKDAVAKELGITQEEGQSSEDALKQKLEDEAKKGLLKLLGGN